MKTHIQAADRTIESGQGLVSISPLSRSELIHSNFQFVSEDQTFFIESASETWTQPNPPTWVPVHNEPIVWRTSDNRRQVYAPHISPFSSTPLQIINGDQEHLPKFQVYRPNNGINFALKPFGRNLEWVVRFRDGSLRVQWIPVLAPNYIPLSARFRLYPTANIRNLQFMPSDSYTAIAHCQRKLDTASKTLRINLDRAVHPPMRMDLKHINPFPGEPNVIFDADSFIVENDTDSVTHQMSVAIDPQHLCEETRFDVSAWNSATGKWCKQMTWKVGMRHTLCKQVKIRFPQGNGRYEPPLDEISVGFTEHEIEHEISKTIRGCVRTFNPEYKLFLSCAEGVYLINSDNNWTHDPSNYDPESPYRINFELKINSPSHGGKLCRWFNAEVAEAGAISPPPNYFDSAQIILTEE